MAHKRFLKTAFIVLAAVVFFGLVFTSCGGGDDNPTSGGGETSATYQTTKDGTTYKLTVNQKADKAASYAPLLGDTYRLLIIKGGTTQTSSGTVSSYIDNVFTLMPANATIAFTIKISGNTIVTINGTITLEGSGGTVQGPGDLQSGGNPPAGGDGDGFTLTDIPSKYNGMHAGVTLAYNAGLPYQVFSAPLTNTNSLISNGRVTVQLEAVNSDPYNGKYERLGKYSGNDTFVRVNVYIQNSLKLDQIKIMASLTFDDVKFSSGNATRSWNNALLVSEN